MNPPDRMAQGCLPVQPLSAWTCGTRVSRTVGWESLSNKKKFCLTHTALSQFVWGQLTKALFFFVLRSEGGETMVCSAPRLHSRLGSHNTACVAMHVTGHNQRYLAPPQLTIRMTSCQVCVLLQDENQIHSSNSTGSRHKTSQSIIFQKSIQVPSVTFLSYLLWEGRLGIVKD